MDVNTLYHRSVEFFADRVNAVQAEQWDDPTPCVGWSVRDLAGHVTYENLWTIPLMEGATIEEVGDKFEGDVLGTDPIGSALAAARAAITSVATQLPLGGTAQLSFGPTPKDEYAMQLAADNLIHGWDLAVATGGDTRIDPHLVHGVATWFGDREEMYRTGGAIAARGRAHRRRPARPARPLRPGRDVGPQPRDAGAVQRRVRRGDVEAALGLVTDDIVFDATSPAPDGHRHEGRDAVRAAWTEVMSTPGMELQRGGVLRLRRPGGRPLDATRWAGSDPGHVRGVDVIRFRDGLVCEKLLLRQGLTQVRANSPGDALDFWRARRSL